MFKTDAEIEADMQSLINDAWPPTKREKALRLGGQLLIDLNAFFDECTLVKSQKIAERDAALAEYEALIAQTTEIVA